MSKFIPNKDHSQMGLIFCFHLKKTVAESNRDFEKLMVKMLHRKVRVNVFRRVKSGDFDTRQEGRQGT